MKSWWDRRAVRGTHSNLVGVQNGTAIKYFGHQFLKNTGMGSPFSVNLLNPGIRLGSLHYPGGFFPSWATRRTPIHSFIYESLENGKTKYIDRNLTVWSHRTGMGATLWVDGHILWLPVLVAMFIKAYQSGHLKPMHFIGFSLYLNSDDLKRKTKYLSLRGITGISVKIWNLKMLNKYGWFCI